MNLVMLDIDGTLTLSYEYDQEIFGLAIGEVLGCDPVNADLNGYFDKTSSGVTEEAIRRVTGKSPTSEQFEGVKHNVMVRLERLQQQSPGAFQEVAGAGRFLEHLRNLAGIGVAIASGCWRSEALFKLSASGIHVDGIPMATSDDDKNRTSIMKHAVERARQAYDCREFERIIYMGDGPWDLQEARALGYGFIGIGPRLKGYQGGLLEHWHPDFVDLKAVMGSINSVLYIR